MAALSTAPLCSHLALLLLFFENPTRLAMIISTLLPPPSPCLRATFLPTQLGVLHVFPYQGQFVLPRCSWLCSLPPKHDQLFRGYAPGENRPFPPSIWQFAATPQLETGLHAHCPFLLGFSQLGLAQVLCMLSHCCALICAACSCC